MKCLTGEVVPTEMSGLLDALLSPKKAAEDWIVDQRRAVAGDIAYQRAMFVAQIREVASEATTEAAIKFAIAGVASFGVCLFLYKLATRNATRNAA